jgi:cardiolipin synthase
MAKAQAGVRVYFLYDDVGCHGLPAAYLEDLRKSGAETRSFNARRSNRFQINFRNHRKITIADGRVAFIGGLNAGDEYMGRSQKFGPWRDTHARIEGPAVQCVQLAFLEDWYWAARMVPDLDWIPSPSPRGDQRVLVLPTSPADELDTCDLFFTHSIHAAQERIWITSPYFVPDDSIVDALQLASLRGVDVRIMLPLKPDHILVYLSSFSYYADMAKAGVKLFRYEPGFMHQKVILLDDEVAAVGTANLDNRSFRLNFELTVLVADQRFVAEVERMLEADFARCRAVDLDELRRRPLWFRIAVAVARLLSPVQ